MKLYRKLVGRGEGGEGEMAFSALGSGAYHGTPPDPPITFGATPICLVRISEPISQWQGTNGDRIHFDPVDKCIADHVPDVH